LYFTEHLKIPVSTTHTLQVQSLVLGLTKRVSAVRWVTVKLVMGLGINDSISALLAAIVFMYLVFFI
jgi:PiT family inorganic phosphate transporter